MKGINNALGRVFFVASMSAALALAACGGNDDNPTPSGGIGILSISNATDPNLNGWYGSGNIGLTGIEDTGDGKIGPSECAFNFDNFSKIIGDRTLAMDGDIRYAYPDGNDVPPLQGDHIRIKGVTYDFVKGGDNFDKAKVDLKAGNVTFKNLLARDSKNNSVELSGTINLPDEKSRDAACKKPAD